MEKFVNIIGYEGLYQISNFGNVKSLNYNNSNVEGLMTGVANRDGYLLVKLSRKGKYKTISIHQLVAIHFLNHTPCGYELVINHKDFNRKNNNFDNLEIITQRANTSKEHLESSSRYVGVCWDKKNKVWIARISINNKSKYLGFFKDEQMASEYYKKALESIENNTEILTYNKTFTSKYKGVGWHKKNKKWTAQIRVNGRMKYLGTFENEIDAHNAYKKALSITDI